MTSSGDSIHQHVTEIDHFADANGTNHIGRITFGYDAQGRLDDIVHRDAADSVLVHYNYVFDLADQLLSETHHGQTSTYSHDLAGQLTSADHSAQTDESYSYDANGNRNSNGYVTGANNQIQSDGNSAIDYINSMRSAS